MENIELTLNRNKSFSSVNEIRNLHLDFESEEKLLPVSDLQGTIDAYEQYLKEKDACNTYRFIFTIRPYCSNILFNHITEGVYLDDTKKGELSYYLFLHEKQMLEFLGQNKRSSYGNDIKGGAYIENNSPITRDTGYSDVLTYNCGIDIFNNHNLRRKNFVCINRLGNDDTDKSMYNTLFDYVRDPDGNLIEGFTYNINHTEEQQALHLYNKDSIYSFNEAITKNIEDVNGWIGFKNVTILDTINDKAKNVNILLKNVNPCSFIDMYPTREHFSFVPFVNNKLNNRIEKNWEYLLTYPYKNIYDNNLIYDSERKIYGIICDLEYPEKINFPGTIDNKITLKQLLGLDSENPVNTPLNITFSSHLKHNLANGDRINLHVFGDDMKVYTSTNVNVVSIGYNGYDSEHYFSVALNDVITDMVLAYGTGNTIGFRFEKLSVGKPCRYYLRKFRKLPNFDGMHVDTTEKISEEDIKTALKDNEFSSSLNKLGFSKTIYGDDISQIIYDNVSTKGLTDNLGRELSVIYLTIVKTNYGHDEWYKISNVGGGFNAKGIEYSHCFGKVSSGFDLQPTVIDDNEYNIHRQHNITTKIDNKLINDIQPSSSKLEEDISIRNDSFSQDFDFFGDIVELNEATLEETVLETIQHRFNTAQREFDAGTKTTNPFAELTIDNIERDDYYDGGFRGITNDIMCGGYWANIAPEGYYYQAHYPIRLKQYDTTINTGYHTHVKFTGVTGNTITTDINYYLETNTELYLFKKNDETNTKYIARVGEVMGDDFTIVEILLPTDIQDGDINDYIIFKPNVLKPDGAYDFGDIEPSEYREKSGRYVWRNILPSSKIPRDSDLYDAIFTNGAIYRYEDINFYVKRQDPYGDYGLHPLYDSNSVSDECVKPCDLEFDGNEMNVTYGDYFEPGENNVC